jgi:tetratricopeptide (TPR) repeat protein
MANADLRLVTAVCAAGTAPRKLIRNFFATAHNLEECGSIADCEWVWEDPLGNSSRTLAVVALLMLLSVFAGAQAKATIDVDETLFSVVAAMNVCGYDQELSASSPIRAEVRADLVEASKLPGAADAADQMCRFYRDHRQGDATHDLAEYVSLALNLGPPPGFGMKLKEADMPPDAGYILGFVPLLTQYYTAANLHSIWVKHQPEYLALIDHFHTPVSQMITATDNYLRMPISGYAGRSFTVYFEPMAAPGQVNSRNYLQDFYYLVVSPAGDAIHMDAIRHTYLHFVLDPLIAKRATSLDRLNPIQLPLQKAPMAEEYKRDMGLLVLECLIRAIEAHTPADPKMPEHDRLALVQRDETEGFVLTGYFYGQLRDFEKGNTGLQNAFPNWLHDIDVQDEKKKASQITFAKEAAPDVMQASQHASQKRVDLAEQALASGNPEEAGKLAQQCVQANEDTSRAYFVLAKVASLKGDMEGAQTDFQKAAESGNDPHVQAWSHIYLGRILDIQGERDSAVAQYKAALAIGDAPPDAKTAAERGVQQAYQPPRAKQDADQ